jgi:hypothetical protein
VIVGDQVYDAGLGPNQGAAFVFLGSAAGVVNGNPSTAHAVLQSDQASALFGNRVASAGDVNGDGYADVIVGASSYDASGEGFHAGAAFIFHGSATGITSGDPTSADTLLSAAHHTPASFGSGVASAGDVNGDGYADVIVGAYIYNAGQPAEGAAFVYLGGPSGIADGGPDDAAAQLESNQNSGVLGISAAGAGDVNGDGFADVIAGASHYDAGQDNEGAAFVFLGGGNRTGRPVLARQLRGNAAVPVQPWAASYTADFGVRARATDPAGRGRVKLQVQACPSGVPFGHASCTSAVSSAWTDVTASGAGTTLTRTLSGLTENGLYRWRARILHAPFGVTQAGITAPPNPAHGPWRRLFGQGVEGDLRIRLDADADGTLDSVDLDDDGDGLSDVDEIGTYLTDPLDADSDDDGLQDGAEVAQGTDPNDEDTDGDQVCDGGAQTGSCTAAGPDNCPFVGNFAQTNGDAYAAGDTCQCGDVTGEGVLTALDYQRAREHVAGRTPGGAFDLDRCDVTGDSLCGVEDLAVLDRLTSGAPAAITYGCPAWTPP